MPIDIFNTKILGPSFLINPKIVEKVWGTEYILPTQDYTVKYMSVKPGAGCSMHMHAKKQETFTLIEGILNITYYTKIGDLISDCLESSLDSLVLPCCTIHSFSVPVEQKFNTIFIESSTVDDPEDSYRMSKSYAISNR